MILTAILVVSQYSRNTLSSDSRCTLTYDPSPGVLVDVARDILGLPTGISWNAIDAGVISEWWGQTRECWPTKKKRLLIGEIYHDLSQLCDWTKTQWGKFSGDRWWIWATAVGWSTMISGAAEKLPRLWRGYIPNSSYHDNPW